MSEWNLEVLPGRRLPLEEIEWRTSRSSGPGGQNVNKVETRVEARWAVLASRIWSEEERPRVGAALAARLLRDGTLRAVSQKGRTQAENRRAACERLARWVAEALRPRARRRPTRRPRAAEERRLVAKKRRGDVKEMRKKMVGPPS